MWNDCVSHFQESSFKHTWLDDCIKATHALAFVTGFSYLPSRQTLNFRRLYIEFHEVA